MENQNTYDEYTGESILIRKIDGKDAIEYFAGLDEDYDLSKMKFEFKSYGQGNGGSYRYYDTSDTVEVYAETISFTVGNYTAHKLGMDGKFKENYQGLFEVAMNNPKVNDLFDYICGRALMRPKMPVNGIAINNLPPGSIDMMLKQKTTVRYNSLEDWKKAHENRANPVYEAECKIDHDALPAEAVDNPNTKNLINSLLGKTVNKQSVDEVAKSSKNNEEKESMPKPWSIQEKCHYAETGNALGNSPELFFTKLGKAQAIIDEAQEHIKMAYDLIKSAPFEIRNCFLRMKAEVGFSTWAIAKSIDYWNNGGHTFKLKTNNSFEPHPESVGDIQEMLDLHDYHFEYDGDSGSEEMQRIH